ncbi:MAG: DUF1254 domain-containing protein [Acidobacteriota bacterium]
MSHQATLGDLRRAILVGIALLTATSPGSAQSLRQTKAPQEYFADRIKMEAGQPAVETIPELYDELDFQRAVQAYVWATPFVSLSALFEGMERDYGTSLYRQVVFEQSVTPDLVVFTGNNTTIYAFGQLDLKVHGPIVLEAPTGTLGGIDNHWQYPLSDIGPFGPERRHRQPAYGATVPAFQGQEPAQNGVDQRQRKNRRHHLSHGLSLFRAAGQTFDGRAAACPGLCHARHAGAPGHRARQTLQTG